MLEIGIVEQCSMHYAALRKVIERITRHLFTINKYIIATSGTGIYTKLLQGMLDHEHITVECKIDISRGSYIGEHDIALVGIDTTATALATIELYVIRATVIGIDLIIDKLVATKDDCRVNLPHEKVILRG
jgi:carbon starvation protein CstA